MKKIKKKIPRKENLSQCKGCKYCKDIKMVDYGELNALGGQIKVPHCYAERYSEEFDESFCDNFDTP